MTYRPCVAGIVQNRAGRILLGERANREGAWQFPQGGIEPGEDPEAALRRELLEEIGLPAEYYRVTARKGPYRYLFPPGFTKKGHNGQEQEYFLVELCRDADAVITAATAAPEFRQLRWIQPADFRLEWLPPMKRPVYQKVFRDFFGVTFL